MRGRAGVDLDAGEIDGPDRRELALDHDAHFAPLVGLLERGRDGRLPDEAIVVDVDDVARDRLGLVAREQIEAHGPPDGERERAAARDVRGPLLGASRDDADRLAAILVADDADEVAARRSPADAHPAAEPRQRVGHRAASDGEIRVGVGQAAHVAAAPAPRGPRRRGRRCASTRKTPPLSRTAPGAPPGGVAARGTPRRAA